jgi:hypothetical protein
MLTRLRDASAKRDFWNKVGAEVKIAKDHIRPVLDSWLLHSIQGMFLTVVVCRTVALILQQMVIANWKI